MDKLKEKIKNIGQIFENIFEKFPITMFVIFAITIIYTIGIDSDWIGSDLVSNITLFSVIFVCGDFIIESIMKNVNSRKIMFYILSAILAGLITYGINIDYDVLGIENVLFINILTRITICYIFSTILIAIYINFKKSNLLFEEYVTRVGVSIFKSSILYFVLTIGIIMITSIFVFLILNGDDYSLVLRMELLLFGLFYLPRIIYSLIDMENEIGKFAKAVIVNILDVLVILAFIIIYVYIGKIMIIRDMPSNQVFRIISTLFVVGCPIWTMTNYFKEKNILGKINQKLPILFIPFIILQIYTIGVRIINNGITEPRYLCVMLIILEIMYVIIYLKNKEKIGNSILVLVAIIVISGVIPYINMFKVSELSQYNSLKIYKAKTDYTQEEKSKIRGAYYYLRNTNNGKKLIEDLLTDEDIEAIIDFEIKEDKKEAEYIYENNPSNVLDIAGYSELYTISAHQYSNVNVDEAFKNIKFNSGDEEEIELDLSSIILNGLEDDNDPESYFYYNNTFELDENRKIIIDYIYIVYDKSTEIVERYSIDGYLLVK